MLQALKYGCESAELVLKEVEYIKLGSRTFILDYYDDDRGCMPHITLSSEHYEELFSDHCKACGRVG